MCVFVILQVEFFVERSGTTDLSPRPKIFVNSVHESQQQQLWLSLHCIHRHTSVCVFVILQVEFFVERSGTTDLSPRPKIFVKAAI